MQNVATQSKCLRWNSKERRGTRSADSRAEPFQTNCQTNNFFSASGRLSCPRVVYVTNIFLFNFNKNNFGFQSINATVFHRESETNCHPQIPASWHVLISSRQSHFCHHHLQTDFCFPIKGNVMKTSDDNLFARFPAPPHRRLREIAANCLLMIFCSDFY